MILSNNIIDRYLYRYIDIYRYLYIYIDRYLSYNPIYLSIILSENLSILKNTHDGNPTHVGLMICTLFADPPVTGYCYICIRFHTYNFGAENMT